MLSILRLPHFKNTAFAALPHRAYSGAAKVPGAVYAPKPDDGCPDSYVHSEKAVVTLTPTPETFTYINIRVLEA